MIDETARLYEAYRPGVFATCLAILGDREEAADATQEIFARALGHLDAVQHPNAWLQTAARHHCTDLLRRRRLAERRGAAPWGAERSHPDPADVVAQREELRSALGSLNDRERRAIVHFVFRDASVADVANRMRLSYAATAQLLTRARRRAVELAQVPSAVVGRSVGRRITALLRRTHGVATQILTAGGQPRGMAVGGVLTLCVSAVCVGGGSAALHAAPGRVAGHDSLSTPAAVPPGAPGLRGTMSLTHPDLASARNLGSLAGARVARAVAAPTPTPCVPAANALTATPTVVWTDPSGDQQKTGANGDIIQATMAVRDDALVVRIYVRDLSLTVPQGATGILWLTGWSFNTPEEGEVDAAVDSAGQVRYWDWNTQQPDSGRYVLGPDGYVEVTVPLAHLHLTPGSLLHGVQGESVLQHQLIGATGTSVDEPIDATEAPGSDYTMGSRC